MLNHKLSLHPDLFSEKALLSVALRDAFGEELTALAEQDERIVALCADVTESVRLTSFKETFPERYIELGVAEQNLALVASGLANYGKLPFIVTYAVFSPGRNWEQIRTTIALAELPVVIVGMHTGVSVGEDGATHQALEDITLMRVLPNMRLVVPADAEETRKALREIIAHPKPTYLRLARQSTPVFTTEDTPFTLSKAEFLWRSAEPKVALIGAGPILFDALCVARALEEEGIGTSVLNVHSIKPMDIEMVKQAAREAGAVVSLEEHQILGGVGGTIAEILTQNTPVPQEMVAVHDRFGQSGTPSELVAEYGLGVPAITRAVRKAFARAHER